MTTRTGGHSTGPFASMNVHAGAGDDPDAVAANRMLFAAAMGATPVFMRQVHGTRVVRVGVADTLPSAAIHDADAAVTSEPGVACAVMVADCLPLLFAAANGRAVGAAHAGWRGLAAGVVEATVRGVCAAADCAPADVVVWLGACIGPAAFEVGADVLEAFGADTSAREATVASAVDASRFRPGRPDRWLADLPQLARDRLLAAGVTQVSGGGFCTVTEASRFFSFRRSGVTGRMVAAVWLDRVSHARR
ncbi:MAG: peptidoglycan editing factor PgeF [Caldimonas sp.]